MYVQQYTRSAENFAQIFTLVLGQELPYTEYSSTEVTAGVVVPIVPAAAVVVQSSTACTLPPKRGTRDAESFKISPKF